MFSIKANKHQEGDEIYFEVELKLELEHLAIRFVPEFPEIIRVIDVNAEKGVIDARPSNGDFELRWEPTMITLYCGKYGDGRGGSLGTVLIPTPAMLASLRSSLQQWKEVVG